MRAWIAKNVSSQVAAPLRILYGGSGALLGSVSFSFEWVRLGRSWFSLQRHRPPRPEAARRPAPFLPPSLWTNFLLALVNQRFWPQPN